MALGPPSAEASERLGLIRSAAQGAGRDPGLVGVEAWVNAADGDMARIAADVGGWRRLGATHVAINSRGRRPRRSASTSRFAPGSNGAGVRRQGRHG